MSFFSYVPIDPSISRLSLCTVSTPRSRRWRKGQITRRRLFVFDYRVLGNVKSKSYVKSKMDAEHEFTKLNFDPVYLSSSYVPYTKRLITVSTTRELNPWHHYRKTYVIRGNRKSLYKVLGVTCDLWRLSWLGVYRTKGHVCMDTVPLNI